jgi:hypothetical protein
MISFFGDPKAWSLHSLQERLKESACSLLLLLPIAFFLSIWRSQLTHTFSIKAFIVFLILCGLSLVYGRLFIKLTALSSETAHNFSLQFLSGYFVLNTILFLLSLATPFTIAADVLILTACGLFIALFCPECGIHTSEPVNYPQNFLCILVSVVGATLWCADSLKPAINDGHIAIYQTWQDSFFHAREISAFSQAHGVRSVSDIQMSGVAAASYHYASYMMPAAVLSLTDSSAYEVFASFMLPFGILLTGLAAFSLAASLWGEWPGLAATVVLVLMPDAYQQGFANKFLSYNFLQQVAPGGLYAVACAAIAWIFILDGCKAGKLASIFLGYALVVISLTYRAHIFVANAFLIMLYPCLFFTKLKVRWRLIIALLLVASFVFIINLLQHSPNIPTLRLDGSGIKRYASMLLASYDPGFFHSLFAGELGGNQHQESIWWLYMASMIVISTFGLWIVAYGLVFLCLMARTSKRVLFFPLLVFINYIVMALGLAMDTKKVGTPEELLHRPFVWAYFVIVVWTGAGIYALLIGNRPPRSISARVFTAMLVFASLAVPIAFAPNLQTMPVWTSSYKVMNSVPSGLVEACLYIRKKSGTEDIVQDSDNDPKFVVTALTERQDFAVENAGGEIRMPKGLRERLDEVAGLKKTADTEKLNEFVRKHPISWYILRPTSVVAWPASFLETSVFNFGGYRVYHFAR